MRFEQLIREVKDFPEPGINFRDITPVLQNPSGFKEVIDSFIDSYVRGETPIPCVQCNQTVKFRDLYDYAKELKSDDLIT